MILCFHAKRFCSARCQIENHHNFPLLPEFLPICHSCVSMLFMDQLCTDFVAVVVAAALIAIVMAGLAHCRCHCVSQSVPPRPISTLPHQKKKKMGG